MSECHIDVSADGSRVMLSWEAANLTDVDTWIVNESEIRSVESIHRLLTEIRTHGFSNQSDILAKFERLAVAMLMKRYVAEQQQAEAKTQGNN